MRAIIAVVVFLVSGSATAQDIQESVVHAWQWFERGGAALRIPCVTSHPLDQQHPDVTRVVVCIHGTLRNANQYHPSLVDACELAGAEADSTLLITPQFLTDADTDHHHLADVLCWSYYGWRQGDHSVSGYGGPRPWSLSSFAMVDSLFLRAAAACPDLRDIVLVGHSAGGQATNRWAAASAVPDLLREARGVRFRGVVMNPSSYLYLSPERRLGGTVDQFAVPTPQQITLCPGYDDYKYGVQDPNAYCAQHPDTLRSRYARRHVAHLAGELDCDPGSDFLDLTCMALWQGDQRLQRCRIYWNYLQWYFGDALHARQAMAVVPGVEHDFHGMFTSACGVYHLFDVGQCGPVAVPDATVAPAVTLGTPYPNPFNPRVTLPVTVAQRAPVTVTIHDLAGRRVATVHAGELATGRQRLAWDGADDRGRPAAAGVYLARVVHPDGTARARLVLVR